MNNYPLSIIYFYLSEGCNLACRHCWIAPKFQHDDHVYPSLNIELLKSIVKQAKPLGLQSVKLTGGEPLLHPEIKEILEFTKNEDLRLVIETNGTLLTPGTAGMIKECKTPHVSVSLDGCDAETNDWVRGVKGCFESAKEGIANLVKAGLKPQIIMTVMRRNKNQIEAVVRLAESLGAASIKFNILQPTARGEAMHESGETLSIEELIELGKWVENELSASTSLRLIFHHPAAFRPLGKILGNLSEGCSICGIHGIIGVLANGSYALCGIGETVPELVFGHAAKDKLAEVWENNTILKELRENLPNKLKGVCGDCLMKHRCLGSCVAQNYYRSRDLFAPFWYCEEAKNQGLFPKTRIRPIKNAA